ncbi:MAG TPA: glycerophosphodiester phosphodiesterase [Jiangellales bacterium]|nr:glycerophosphodiester phosphodiesterase [Jiangellales bacterium]
MLAIAHRGGNSLAALRHALAAGVDLVEADVRLFRGRPEIRHLKTLGPWLLWDHPWELVRRTTADLPSLDQVLATLNGADRLMLDLKGSHPALAPQVARTLRSTVPDTPIAVCTRHWRMLDAFRGDDVVRLVLSAGSRSQLGRLRVLLRSAPDRWPGRRRAFGVSVKRTLVTGDDVVDLRRAVDHVMTWPVDTPAELDQAQRLGATGVIGKDLRLLGDVLAARGPH